MRVFVYGSLLPGMSYHAVVEPYVISGFCGRVRGKLVDLGPYPALVEVGDGCVRGMWLEILREALPRLDELEEFFGIEEKNVYERVWTRDADRPDMQGWAYVWTDARGYPDAGGDWWPDVWAGKRK